MEVTEIDTTEGRDVRRRLLSRLADAWDSSTSGIEQVDEDRYVQWAGYGIGMQIESVSNRFLTEAARLTTAQVEQLRRQGWRDPLGDDLPNFWRTFVDRGDLPVAAAALMEAVEVLRVRAGQRDQS